MCTIELIQFSIFFSSNNTSIEALYHISSLLIRYLNVLCAILILCYLTPSLSSPTTHFNNARTIWSDESSFILSYKLVFDFDHVLLGNSFRDTDN